MTTSQRPGLQCLSDLIHPVVFIWDVAELARKQKGDDDTRRLHCHAHCAGADRFDGIDWFPAKNNCPVLKKVIQSLGLGAGLILQYGAYYPVQHARHTPTLGKQRALYCRPSPTWSARSCHGWRHLTTL
jgi:hypothetical protein